MRRRADGLGGQARQQLVKELWLLLENPQAKFPLYPGERTWIHYSYTISHDQWGRWFQRAVRLPTRRLSVRLAFPTQLLPTVWGTEISYTAGQLPLRARSSAPSSMT